jgi:hypothetical protein
LNTDLIEKVLKIVAKRESISEADVCYLMVIFRKILEGMVQSDQESFLILRLFSNWAVHIEITQSNTGLRILSAINNALVNFQSAVTDDLQLGISREIGFVALREELRKFSNKIQINEALHFENHVWSVFVSHLIEIIRDSPLSFPDLSSLDKKKEKIYKSIANNPIKPGAGVVSIQISNVDYAQFGAENLGSFVCLIIVTEDTTKIVVPIVRGGGS